MNSEYAARSSLPTKKCGAERFGQFERASGETDFGIGNPAAIPMTDVIENFRTVPSCDSTPWPTTSRERDGQREEDPSERSIQW